jgi:type III restriction enzyme
MAPRKTKQNPAQTDLLTASFKTAPCVPAIQSAVDQWRADDYRGCTGTTRTLLNYWFKTDHRSVPGGFFKFHNAQRRAIETLVYLFEVAKVRRHADLVQRYASSGNLGLLRYDEFPRYGIKMATGSGKTKVMALTIAWQYFNAVCEGLPDYATSFLLLAPNVIVLERLATDFGSARIFRSDPIIPDELHVFWDLECYMRGEAERAKSQGALYVTNIQQFREEVDSSENVDDPLTDLLGSPPASPVQRDSFDRRILSRPGRLCVLNDEAHHTHDEDSEWNRFIRSLNATSSIVAQLDFSATPRHSKGTLFTWIVFDYPLKQAIIDGIVKRPMKGVAAGITEQPSDIASVRYRAFITAAVERWREYRDALSPLNKRPILFVMMNETRDADDVGDYLRSKYPVDFGADQTLIIHTDRSGEVSKKDVDLARRAAHDVDSANSPVNAIVSVLMLREGWDVSNVTVVLGLRPYTSTAAILPEQTMGRGLRLMFRESRVAYTERVDIIGNRAFLNFVDELEKIEDLTLETFTLGKDKVLIQTIFPDPTKLDKDITVPVLSPILVRKKSLASEIEELDVDSLDTPPLPLKQGDQREITFRYEGYDFLTLQKLIEREYTIPQPQTAEEVVSYYAKRIAQDVKLPSQFSVLAPKVMDFFRHKAFGEEVDLQSPEIIRAMASNVAQYVAVTAFVRKLRTIVVEEATPQLLDRGRPLSSTPPFPFSRKTMALAKCLFNLTPCDNEFELKFARFLNDASDVCRFSKLPPQFGFAIEYTDSVSNLRYYEPDFVAQLVDGSLWLIETKGREDTDVRFKDRAAMLWCENASALTEVEWSYLKVAEGEFKKLNPDSFSDLTILRERFTS